MFDGGSTARMNTVPAVALFAATAILEIVGCYLPLQHLAGRCGLWAYPAAAASLAGFVWLLTLHPVASGRVYAAYGGIYILMSVCWLWTIDRVRPTAWDMAGLALCLAGSLLIYCQPRSA